jgi:hypothetical protein
MPKTPPLSLPQIDLDAAKIKPNNQSPPGPIGNTTGIILPQTAPNPKMESAPPIKPKQEEKGWWKRWGSDAVHLGLDVIGLIPGVGEIADGANALIYLAEGDTVNAAISAAAMIPGAGMAATGAKLGKKAAGAVAEGVAKKGAREGAEELAEKAAKEKAEKEAAEKAAKEKAEKGGKDKGKGKPPCGKSGPYKDRKDHDNSEVNWDHIPSKKALLERAEKLKGDVLTSAERTAIVEGAPSIAIPTKLHQKHSRTYGGRNKKAAAEDSGSLVDAIRKDTDEILDNIDKYDPGCKGKYKDWADKMKKMTEDDLNKMIKKLMKSAGD